MQNEMFRWALEKAKPYGSALWLCSLYVACLAMDEHEGMSDFSHAIRLAGT